MDATWQRARRRRRDARRRRQPRPRRAGEAADAAPLARRLGGALLRPRGLGPRLAGRRGARGAAARLRHPARPTRRSTRSSPGPTGSSTSSSARATRPELGWLPRSRAIRLGGPWVEGRDDDPWDVEATVEPLAVRRAGAAAGEHRQRRRGRARGARGTRRPTAPLATRERSTLAGLHWEKLDAGRRGCVPHCHSAEEEVFVILDGTATLELWPSPRSESDASRGDPAPRGPRGGAPAGDARLTLVPRRPRGRDDAHLRHARA